MNANTGISRWLCSPAVVWFARLLLGGVFAFSGLVKAVDPWGFIFKLTDYLGVWGWDVSRPLLLVFAIGLSVGELTLGVLVLLGSWRRVSIWACAALMLVMTPLTAWLWLASPVADCGCFGDAVVLSNAATFWKNVVLDGLILYLWIFNRSAEGVLKAQYTVYAVALTLIYSVTIALTGYLVQPFIDFRPYVEGMDLRSATNESLDDPVIFDLFDNEDAEVGRDILSSPDTTVLVLEAEPSRAGLQMRHFADRLSQLYPTYLVTPDMPQHEGMLMADDTQIKAMARGDLAVMVIADGRVLWKRSLAMVASDALDVDNGRAVFNALRPHLTQRFVLFTVIYLILMAGMVTLSLTRIKPLQKE